MHQKCAVFDLEKEAREGERDFMGWRGGGVGNDYESIIIVADVTRGINLRRKKMEK
jgi:hypothetical protein